ncbi:TFIIB-type zinc ribbon-containing protein [Desulfurococcaceae archaeon MEX13E-LK6-19]|nr:TFIIB-type zinc ribbon-containing protein [Desulfurococcaceae archaeon MEX13E-LK6-19]
MGENYSSNCGGPLVWDYFRGEVICSTTGEVVDRIYDYSDTRSTNQEDTKITIDTTVINRHKNLLRDYRRNLKMYRKALSLIKNRPWLQIDFDKVVETGKFVNTIYSKSTLKALETVDKMGISSILKKIIRFIEEIDPVAVSRTERTKLALAYMVYKKMKGEPVSPKEVVEYFNISLTTYKRLEKLLKRIISKTSLARIRTVIH